MQSDQQSPTVDGGPEGVRSTVLEWIPRLGLVMSASGISLMVILIIAEVVSTKLFNYSLPYVLEYSEYLIPIITFWGAAYALRVGGHVRADLVVHRLPEVAREWIFLIGYLLGLVFLIVAFKQSLDVAILSIKMNRYSFYPTPSPLGPPQLILSLGIALFALQLVIEIAVMVKRLFRSNSLT